MKLANKTCLDRFEKIMSITRMMATICGCNCVQRNFKMSALTWFVIIAINMYFLCTLYTIYIGFVVNGDWKIVLQTLSLAGSAVQGYSKMLCGIRKRFILVSMYERIQSIYKEYQTDKDFLTVLRYRTDLTTKILKAVMSIYVAAVIVIIMYPLVYGMLYGEKLLIMSFYLPGIDPDTDMGHLIHNIVHAVLISLGGFGNFAGDMYVFIMTSHVPLLKDVIKVKCEKLNRGAVSAENPQQTIPMLKDLVLWHQNYNTYAQELEKAYYVIIFVQIFTSVVCISCTLFSIVIKSWQAAYAYLIYSSIMMYAYCGLGHLVEISNDEVTNAVYCDCLWYELTVPEQKLVLLMLRKSQVPTNLTIGQVMPLSMNTALQLTKAIYSYMMMLVNFLD